MSYAQAAKPKQKQKENNIVIKLKYISKNTKDVIEPTDCLFVVRGRVVLSMTIGAILPTCC